MLMASQENQIYVKLKQRLVLLKTMINAVNSSHKWKLYCRLNERLEREDIIPFLQFPAIRHKTWHTASTSGSTSEHNHAFLGSLSFRNYDSEANECYLINTATLSYAVQLS